MAYVLYMPPPGKWGEFARAVCVYPPCGQTEVLRRFCPGGGVFERRPGDDKAFRIPLYRRFRAF
ncbi:MAG TPA: hypothetical protein DCX90_09925 [Ruminococcaceae bacterium]|nr:hypothetical protein [Oscillospiraceae bacterium]